MIKILHLYPDLMNLYGENGNLLAIKHYLENGKIKHSIDKKSIKDNINFDDYNIVYMGCGTENNQKLVLKHILEYKEEIRKYIEDDKILIATGNSYELFGKYIENVNGKRFSALGFFNYYAKETNDRIVKQFNNGVRAFLNIGSVIHNNNNPTFEIKDYKDGYKYKNFYGTHLIGPLLVLNESILKDIIKSIEN